MKTLEEIGAIEFNQTEAYYDNVEKYGYDEDLCICCGKKTKSRYFVNTIEGPEAIKADVTTEDLDALGLYSQGMFPIGSTCLKRMEKSYIIDTQKK